MYIDFEKIRFFNSKRRRIVLALFDILILIFSIWLSFWLRLGYETNERILNCLWLFPSFIISGIPLYFFTGQYRALTRHVRSKAFYQIVGRNLLIVLIVSSIGVMFQYTMPPRSSWILIWILLSVFIGGFRFLLRDFLLENNIRRKLEEKSKDNVIIYGAGITGAKLASSLKETSKVLFFVDDSPILRGRTVDGIIINSPKAIKTNLHKIDKILLAISSISNSERNIIINRLKRYKIPVQTIPSIEDIISKRVEVTSQKTIRIEELLGREKVMPVKSLLSKGVKGNSILITGAGGSIGSELCRQLIKLGPSKIILLELSEHALFKIEKTLIVQKDSQTFVKGVLGDASDEELIRKIFSEESIDIVFHAAAYKHVPIVEINPLVGIKNNVFSTFQFVK